MLGKQSRTWWWLSQTCVEKRGQERGGGGGGRSWGREVFHPLQFAVVCRWLVWCSVFPSVRRLVHHWGMRGLRSQKPILFYELPPHLSLSLHFPSFMTIWQGRHPHLTMAISLTKIFPHKASIKSNGNQRGVAAQSGPCQMLVKLGKS